MMHLSVLSIQIGILLSMTGSHGIWGFVVPRPPPAGVVTVLGQWGSGPVALSASASSSSAESEKTTKADTATATTTTSKDDDPAEHMYDVPDHCYVIYPPHAHDAKEEPPTVVCTNDPEEFAWFNGLDVEDLIPTDAGTSEQALECHEGASPRGIPEWECTVAAPAATKQEEDATKKDAKEDAKQ